MPSYNDDAKSGQQIAKAAASGLYGDLTKLSTSAQLMGIQKASEDVKKSVSDMLLGPTRDQLVRSLKIDTGGALAAWQAQSKIDMSGFLAHYQKQTNIDTSRIFPHATESPLLKAFRDDMTSKYGNRLTPPTADIREESADLAETIEEIEQQTPPEVTEAFYTEVLIPSMEEALVRLDTELTDADYKAFDSVFANMTADVDGALDDLPSQDPEVESRRASIVAKLKARYPDLTDRQLGKGVIIHATSLGILAASLFYPVILVFVLAHLTIVGGLYAAASYHARKKSD